MSCAGSSQRGGRTCAAANVDAVNLDVAALARCLAVVWRMRRSNQGLKLAHVPPAGHTNKNTNKGNKMRICTSVFEQTFLAWLSTWEFLACILLTQVSTRAHAARGNCDTHENRAETSTNRAAYLGLSLAARFETYL
jgi:hypothetical protein